MTNPNFPIFIWGPTARNGVTLLQRLLNSTKDIVCFGENEWFLNHVGVVLRNAQAFQNFRGVVLNEQKKFQETSEFWSTNLNPDPELFLKSSQDFLQSLLQVYQAEAKKLGRDRWGVKSPMYHVDLVKVFQFFLPQSRHVFVIRDLEAVAKSYKGRGWLGSLDDVRHLKHQYDVHLKFIHSLSGKQNLILAYEDLIQGGSVLQNLENFCEVPGQIHEAVLNTKINAFGGEYVNPMPLTEEEFAVLKG